MNIFANMTRRYEDVLLMYILKSAVYPQLLMDQHSKSRDNYMLIPYRRELIKYVFKSVSASAIAWNELKNMSILCVGRYSSSDSYTQSWFPVYESAWFVLQGRQQVDILYFYSILIQRAKLKNGRCDIYVVAKSPFKVEASSTLIGCLSQPSKTKSICWLSLTMTGGLLLRLTFVVLDVV